MEDRILELWGQLKEIMMDQVRYYAKRQRIWQKRARTSPNLEAMDNRYYWLVRRHDRIQASLVKLLGNQVFRLPDGLFLVPCEYEEESWVEVRREWAYTPPKASSRVGSPCG